MRKRSQETKEITVILIRPDEPDKEALEIVYNILATSRVHRGPRPDDRD